MGTAERRIELMKLLCRRRHETIANLAAEFSVSERTIRRDIEILSYSEPIYTQAGRYGGGVYVTEDYRMDRMYFGPAESEVVHKLYRSALAEVPCRLSREEQEIMERLLKAYSKPPAKAD